MQYLICISFPRSPASTSTGVCAPPPLTTGDNKSFMGQNKRKDISVSLSNSGVRRGAEDCGFRYSRRRARGGSVPPLPRRLPSVVNWEGGSPAAEYFGRRHLRTCALVLDRGRYFKRGLWLIVKWFFEWARERWCSWYLSWVESLVHHFWKRQILWMF